MYMATICWDGYDEYTEGEYTVVRHSLDDLFEGVEEYLDRFKARSPYLECASVENYKDDSNKVLGYKDITDSLKLILKTRRNK